jgi:hypothetical protein
MTDTIVIEVEAPQNPVKAVDLTGPQGDPGDNGFNGWSPVFSTVSDGARRVQRITNWTGGTGTKPAVGKYVGATGLVDNIADAVDIRGAQGTQGEQGPAGADGAVVIGGDTAVITGEGPPDDADGIDEQLYFDTLNEDLYQKKSGHWELQANLKGEKGDKGDKGDPGEPGADGVAGADGDAGTDGNTIRFGLGVPNDAVGIDGDLYIRTSNADLYSRTSGAYAVIVNLKGPQGNQGIKGDKGDQGNPGATGDKGDKGDPGDPGDDGPAGAPGPTLNPRGAFDIGTTYAAYDDVRVDGVGSFYSLIDANTGHQPESSPTQWHQYAADGEQGAAGAKGDKGDTGDQGPSGAKGDKGDTGDQGPAGDDGAAGPAGTSVGYRLAFSSTVTDTDPGAGKFLLNNANSASATQINIASPDADGNGIGNILQSLDDTDNKGIITLKALDGLILSYAVTGAVVNHSSYYTIPVSALVAPANPADGKVFYLATVQNGNDGDQGIQGVKGDKGDTGNTGAAGADGNSAMTLTSKSAAYTLVSGDANQGILHPAADTTARTFTIPANSSVAYAVGTMLTFINQHGAGTVTIAITTDTMRLAADGSTGSRTLTADGIAVAVKITSTEWLISGVGLT